MNFAVLLYINFEENKTHKSFENKHVTDNAILAQRNRGNRPIYIGKNQNPKKMGFLLYRLHCQKNP